MFTAVFAGSFIYLGIWQLERADEKNWLLDELKERRQQEGVSLSALPEDEEKLASHSVEIRGVYDPAHQFLLDNRVLEGRVGFEVLVPVYVPESEITALVNRGFVPMGRTRSDTPDIPPLPAGKQPISGHIYMPEENPLVDESDGNLVGRPPWPIIVQVSNPALLQRELDRELFPYVIRLAEDDPHALPRDWRVTTIMPHRHWGYAVQWFLMALVVVIAWLAFSLRKDNDGVD